MALSFDFDDTLSIPLVQDYCKSLIDIGIDVYVITYRCNEFNNVKLLNLDLYEVTDRLGISRDKVILTCYKPKYEAMKELGISCHIDDCDYTISEIEEEGLKAIDVKKGIDHIKSKVNDYYNTSID